MVASEGGGPGGGGGGVSDSKAGLTAEIVDGVGVLTIRDPERRNALSSAMWDQLADALRRFGQDDAVRAIVLTGAGHAAFATGTLDWERALPAFEALAGCRCPLVARVRGDCLGTGLVLALAADLRVGAADCAFAFPVDEDPAPVPQPVLDRLVALVGPGQAARLLFAGTRVEAAEAARIGLLEWVLDDAELSDGVADLMKSISDAPAEFLAAVKLGLTRAVGRAG